MSSASGAGSPALVLALEWPSELPVSDVAPSGATYGPVKHPALWTFCELLDSTSFLWLDSPCAYRGSHFPQIPAVTLEIFAFWDYSTEQTHAIIHRQELKQVSEFLLADDKTRILKSSAFRAFRYPQFGTKGRVEGHSILLKIYIYIHMHRPIL